MARGPLTIGSKGRLAGIEFTVAGYAVVGMYEEGELYTWVEYALEGQDGQDATLEFDEGRWKLMADYTPRQGPSAVQLSSLGPGSSIQLDGQTLRVTENDSAVLSEVEGKNDLAFPGETRWSYLDATSPGRIWAAEWFGSRVAWVRGRYVATSEVAAAFGIKEFTFPGGAAIELMLGSSAPAETKRASLHTGLALLVASILALTLALALGNNLVKQEAVQLPPAPVGMTPEKFSRDMYFGPLELDPTHNGYQLQVYSDAKDSAATASGKLEVNPPVSQPPLPPSNSAGWMSTDEPVTKAELQVKEKKPYYVQITIVSHDHNANVGYILTSDRKSTGWLWTYAVMAFIGGIVLTCVGAIKN